MRKKLDTIILRLKLESYLKKKKNHISRGHKYHKKAHSLDLTPFLPLSQLFPFLSLICG